MSSPAVLLPSQVFPALTQANATARGGRRLLLAVLENAVHQWGRYCHAQQARERRLFRETEDWFWSTRRDYLCAFECICDYLQLDPSDIRRGLLMWQQAQPMPHRSVPSKGRSGGRSNTHTRQAQLAFSSAKTHG